MLAGRRRPLCAPRSAAMGEMQGALARARLESLLRPRHKKRAEAQKRSESVLLSGLGKCRRPALRDKGGRVATRGTMVYTVHFRPARHRDAGLKNQSKNKQKWKSVGN